MNYIITEEQNDKLYILRKLIRRDEEIKGLIHTYCKRPLINYEMVLEWVALSLYNKFNIKWNEDESIRVIKKYLREHYGELIKKLLEK